MSLPMIETGQEPDVGAEQEELPAAGRPVILLMTRKLESAMPGLDPVLCQLAARFDIRLVESPSLALAMSRIVQANDGSVVLLLSDMMSNGADILSFISMFNQDWPDAGLHFFDAVEGRVIFSEPDKSGSDRPPAIRIEANGREPLDSHLVLRMVERYFPRGAGD